jgi:hypothetical protein
MTKVSVPAPTVQSIGTFTNSAGEVYTIRGLSPMLPQKILDTVKAEFAAAGKTIPPIPTYTIPANEIHGEEVHEHNETSILEGTPEQVEQSKAAWFAYQSAIDALNNEHTTRMMRAMFMAVDVKPTQSWRDEMKFIGAATPPENSPAEKYAFIETHVVQTPSDLTKLMTSVFRMSGIISEAAVAEVDATFQRFVEDAYSEAGKPTGKAG